jgi:phenylalanyl-tRNA synthetase alpha chain
MKKQLEELKTQIELFEIKQSEQVENFRLKFLSKKGTLNQLFEEFKTIPSDMKKEVGALLNQVKQKAQQKWEESQVQFESNKTTNKTIQIDLTLPSDKEFNGSRHPLKVIENEIIDMNRFQNIGIIKYEADIEEEKINLFTNAIQKMKVKKE